MQFSQSLSFPFRGKSAWANLGCLALCFLIPIVGPIVMLGYIIKTQYVLLQNLNADAPRFDFGKFSVYLSRGVQAFLANLVLNFIFFLPMMVLNFVLMFCFIAGVAFLHEHLALIITLVVVAAMFYLLYIIIGALLISPLYFKAAMEDRFAAAFDLRFGLGYLRRVGLHSLMYHVLLFLIALPFMLFACIPLLGILVAYAVTAFMSMANAHLQVQLYLEYVNRGGAPITPKYEPPEPAFPVLPSDQPMPPMPPAPGGSNFP